jgi:hypothetical protein
MAEKMIESTQQQKTSTLATTSRSEASQIKISFFREILVDACIFNFLKERDTKLRLMTTFHNLQEGEISLAADEAISLAKADGKEILADSILKASKNLLQDMKEEKFTRSIKLR